MLWNQLGDVLNIGTSLMVECDAVATADCMMKVLNNAYITNDWFAKIEVN